MRNKQNNWRGKSWKEYQKDTLVQLISPEFEALIEEAKTAEDKNALRRQVYFDNEEMCFSDRESADPLGESNHAITPFLVHQYKNRVLLLATGKCFSHCRYCFRKSYTARPQGFITNDEIDMVCSYLAQHKDIDEVLISGGDPLTASMEELSSLLASLRKVSDNLILRICTRAPIFAPSIFSSELLSLLEDAKPLWVIPHINHVAELGISQRKCLGAILKRGIAMQSQSVLLKGVNDDVHSLVSLFHTLAKLAIKPGYLFQLDMAFGTSHFRVPLDKALSLWEEVREELSGLSTPVFAVDLMDGGGKFPLSSIALQNTFYYDGKETLIKKKFDKTYIYSTANNPII